MTARWRIAVLAVLVVAVAVGTTLVLTRGLAPSKARQWLL